MVDGVFATGQTLPNPLLGQPSGTSITLEFVTFLPAIPAISGPIIEWDHFGSVLLQISFKDASGHSFEGSGVMIGPGLAYTATHIFADNFGQIVDGSLTALVTAIVGDTLQIWTINQIMKSETDVCVLRLDIASDLPSNNNYRCAKITTRMPSIGEDVMIAGFRQTVGAQGDTPGEGNTHIGIGKITNVYPNGRDRVMLPFPCVEISCDTAGGMSGGPAFDQHGKLLGILSTSLGGEGGIGPSYISLIWPTFATIVEGVAFPGLLDRPRPLVELATFNFIAIDRPDVVTVSHESSGDTHIGYEPWR